VTFFTIRQAEVVVVSVLAAIVGIVLIALGVYLCHQHANGLLFQRGDYRFATLAQLWIIQCFANNRYVYTGHVRKNEPQFLPSHPKISRCTENPRNPGGLLVRVKNA
jgi:hypothetical protein